MRIFVLLGLLAGSALVSGGCETLAYTGKEHRAQIARSWSIDAHQIPDDVDSLLLLRPPSRMTVWHVR